MAKPIVDVAQVRELLNYDPETGVFTWRVVRSRMVKAGDVAGSVNAVGYRYITIKRRHYLAHRLAWLFVHGVWPAIQIDHENGLKDDNRLENLREATRSLNQQNQRRAQAGNKSGLIGAHWNPNDRNWRSHIMVNGKTIGLGAFQSAQAAHEAYLRAKRIHHAGCTI